jgi:hypothetical protein
MLTVLHGFAMQIMLFLLITNYSNNILQILEKFLQPFMLLNEENSLLFSCVKLLKEIRICKSRGQEAVLENNYSCMFVMDELNEQVHGNIKMECLIESS